MGNWSQTVKTIASRVVSGTGLIGLAIALWKPVYRSIDMLHNIDFIRSSWDSVGTFLDTGWGTLTSVTVGTVIIGYSILRGLALSQQSSRDRFSATGIVESGPILPDTAKWPTPYAPISVVGRTFRNERVVLDGYSYTACEFHNVTFMYNGTTAIQFNNNKVDGSTQYATDSPSVSGAILWMRGFGLLKEDVPIHLPPGNKIDVIVVRSQIEILNQKLAENRSQEVESKNDKRSTTKLSKACDAWRYSEIIELWQAACLLEDIEPQLPLPPKVVPWYGQLALALENGELDNLSHDQVNKDSLIKIVALRKFAEVRKLTPHSLSPMT